LDAAARRKLPALLATAMQASPETIKVTRLDTSRKDATYGEAAVGKVSQTVDFVAAVVDGKPAVIIIDAPNMKHAASPHRLTLEQAQGAAERYAARLYPRWTAAHMKLVQARTAGSDRASPGGPDFPVVYEFRWQDAPQDHYETWNSVDMQVDAATGRVFTYSAGFAATPLHWPRITPEQATRIARAELRKRLSPELSALTLLRKYSCLIGGPKQDPIWHVEYERSLPSPTGEVIMSFGSMVTVNGVTGQAVVDQL
jgi:hypothetical protein